MLENSIKNTFENEVNEEEWEKLKEVGMKGKRLKE